MGNGKILDIGDALPVTCYGDVFWCVYEHLDVFNIKAWAQSFVAAPFDSGFLADGTFAKWVGDQKHSAAPDNF